MKGTDLIATRTNILYVLTDVLETQLMDLSSDMRKNNLDLRHDVKRNYNTAIAAIRRIKSDLAKISMVEQLSFAQDAETVNAMILTMLDRFADTDEHMFQLYSYMKSFPSKLGMDLNVDDAFEGIVMNGLRR